MSNPFDDVLKKDEAEKITATEASEVGASANKKLQEAVTRASQFNNRLEMEQSGRTLESYSIPMPGPVSNIGVKMARIASILRDKGLGDSQQREQVLIMIREVLEEV